MNKKEPKHTKTQRFKIAVQICDNYSTGKHTLKSCIENAGIVERTFFLWLEKGNQGIEKGGYKDILELYEEAGEKKREANRRELRDLTVNSLIKLLTGGAYEEKHYVVSEEGEKKKKLAKVIKKTREPNPSVAIFMAKAILCLTEGDKPGEDSGLETLVDILQEDPFEKNISDSTASQKLRI